MKILLAAIVCSLSLVGCSTKDPYDAKLNLAPVERDSLLTSIVNYIFIAPPYTLMQDRFKPEHRGFYTTASSKFIFDKYYVAPDGIHYFYVLRPAPKLGEKRGVGGFFKLNEQHQITGFREVFVTQIMSEKDVRDKCNFLFDEMAKGNIEKYLGMEAYIQWPNKISYYDTVSYEWKMNPE